MSFARTNLCANPRAAVDTTGWVVEATAEMSGFSLARSTAWGILPDGSIGPGGTSFEVEATKSGNTNGAAAGILTAAPVDSNGFACEEGEQYTISSYVQTLDPSVARGYFQRILWYDAGGTFISTSTGNEVADEGVDGARLADTFTAAAGAVRGRPNVRIFTLTPDDVISFRATAILLEEAALLGSYFDGDFDFAEWTGTSHESTSTLHPSMRVRRDGGWVDGFRRVRRGGVWVPTGS